MSKEQILADFSGGMNALEAVDKLQPNELLLAENARLDETGEIAVSGAFTHQNTAAYLSTASASNVHSLYWNPALGGVAGVGADVFSGTSLGTLTNAISGTNTGQQKMSFGDAPSRVYFDIGSVGYWSNMSLALKVDWPPPPSASTGPNTGTLANNTETGYGFSLNTAIGMSGVEFAAVVVETITAVNLAHGNNALTAWGTLVVGGVPVGTPQSVSDYVFSTGTYTHTLVIGIEAGGGSLFGYPSLTAAQVNASNFGVILSYTLGPALSGSAAFTSAPCTAFQGSTGFGVGTAAGTLVGTYSWAVTFVATSGEESDLSPTSTAVILNTQAGTLTSIPTGDARTASRNIYRIGGALTSLYLVGSIPDNVTTTFYDDLSDIQALTEGVIAAGQIPGVEPNTRLGSQNVRFPAYHYDRVFWTVPNTNQIIWSSPLNGFAYPAVNFAEVGDSKPVVRCVSIFGELVIIKQDCIWVLTGTDESSFTLSQTPSAVGTDQPFSIVRLSDKIIFANKYNLWSFNGYTSVPLTNKLDTWFKQRDRTNVSLFGVNGFHPIEVANSQVTQNFDAAGNAEKYYLSYAEAGQQSNNACLLIDLKHGNITKRPTAALSLAIDPVTGLMYMGDALGFVSLLDDWNGAQAGSVPLNFDVQTGYNNFARGSNQAMWALEFYINTNGNSVTPYVYYDGGESSEVLAPIVTTSMQRVVRPLQASASRKAQNISVRFNASLTQANISGTPQILINSIKPYFDIRVGRARTGQ
jgi:hypothetical protein